MDPHDYEYSGLMATTWDLFRGDTSAWEDRSFFREVIGRSGEPVLDVGCGTGRLLLDYLADGVDADGVDVSPEMLALCRDKARRLDLEPRLYEQSMEALRLPRRYRTIIVPSSSFQLLTDRGAAQRALDRLYAHLQPGGVLAMPFMILWRDGDPLETDWQLNAKEVRPEDGAIARRWSRAWYDVAERLEYTEDRYEIRLGEEVLASEHHRRAPATRWYTQSEAVQLYRAAGLSGVRVFREFSFEPAGPTDTLFSVLGTRPWES